MVRVFRLFCLSAILAAFALPALAHASFNEESCFVPGVRSELRCYTMERPLGAESSETVRLGGIIFPAKTGNPEADPLVILAGGPGEAASDMVPFLSGLFGEVLLKRDLVFFDIRGAGRSMPVNCRESDETPVPLASVDFEEERELIKTCFEENKALVSSFSTRTAVADLEALRVALGVEQFNLWGGSYGTQLVQYYLHAYPDRARSAVLDAVVPFTPSYLPLQPANALNALTQLTQDCAADEKCAEVFPQFDAIELLDRIGDEREITYRHPVTGQKVRTVTNRMVVAQTIGMALYAPESRVMIPYILTEAVVENNWAPLSALALDTSAYMGRQMIYQGTFLSTTCAEEQVGLKAMADKEDPVFNGAAARFLSLACEAWPVAPDPLPRPEEGEIATPTIMISGDYDPITPPSLADAAAETFSNVKHFRVANGGHMNSRVACIIETISEFVKDPHDETLEPDCQGDGHVPAFLVGMHDSDLEGDDQ